MFRFLTGRLYRRLGRPKLCAIRKNSSSSRHKGISFLIENRHYEGAAFSYPTGIGLPKQFYIRYHSYPYVFSALRSALL
ncbi:hypothetical protein QNN00_15600 [Bacillus velezensis]|nr:hypothetical protein [Bacillus velezensis]